MVVSPKTEEIPESISWKYIQEINISNVTNKYMEVGEYL